MQNIFQLHYKNIFIWLLICFIFSILLTGQVSLFIYEAFLFYIIYLSLIFICKNFIVRSKNFLTNIFFFSFFINVIFVFVNAEYLIYHNGFPFLSLNDDYNYELISNEIKARWEREGIGFYDNILFSTGFYSGYPNFSALIKYLLGNSFYLPRILNSFFLSCTVILFYRNISLFVNKNIAKEYTYLFAISTLFIFFSSFQLKDTILLFFVSLALLSSSKLLLSQRIVKYLFLFCLSCVFIMFFRAAIILPILSSLILANLISNFSFKSLAKKIYILIIFLFAIFLIYNAWDYLHVNNILPYDFEGYYDIRLNSNDSQGKLQGSSSLNSLGVISFILGPIYILFSGFLPTPVFVDIYSDAKTLNYSFIPLISYYSILPYSLVSILLILKKFKNKSFLIFFILFIFLYKIGQASSKSIFDARQSLPALYSMYILLAIKFYDIKSYDKLYFKYKKIIFIIMLFVMVGFSAVRYFLRNQ